MGRRGSCGTLELSFVLEMALGFLFNLHRYCVVIQSFLCLIITVLRSFGYLYVKSKVRWMLDKYLSLIDRCSRIWISVTREALCCVSLPSFAT
jgi:hypothetical protein